MFRFKFCSYFRTEGLYQQAQLLFSKLISPVTYISPFPTNFSCRRNISSVSENSNSPVRAAPTEGANTAITSKGEGFYKAD